MKSFAKVQAHQIQIPKTQRQPLLYHLLKAETLSPTKRFKLELCH